MLDPHALLRLLACELPGSTLFLHVYIQKLKNTIKILLQLQIVLSLLKPYQIIHLLHCSELQTVDNKVTSLSQYVCGSLTVKIYYESMVQED